MRKCILLLLMCTTILSNAQVRKIIFEPQKGEAGFDDLKDATVHVIVKDFCDESKPYKKILQENWTASKLSFDYSEDFDFYKEVTKGGKEGEWYMFIDLFYIGDKDEADTPLITVAKATGKRGRCVDRVIFLALFESNATENIHEFQKNNPNKFSMYTIAQSLDLSKSYFNMGNEYFFKNTLQILNQFVEKRAWYWLVYKKNFMSCESLDKVLASVLYVPQYALVSEVKYIELKKFEYRNEYKYANPSQAFSGYKSDYKVLTNEEMVKMFKSGKPFYYLLTTMAGDHKLNYVVESTTGKIMCIANRLGPMLQKNDMLGLYENLKSKEYCK